MGAVVGAEETASDWGADDVDEEVAGTDGDEVLGDSFEGVRS